MPRYIFRAEQDDLDFDLHASELVVYDTSLPDPMAAVRPLLFLPGRLTDLLEAGILRDLSDADLPPVQVYLAAVGAEEPDPLPPRDGPARGHHPLRRRAHARLRLHRP